MINQVIMNALLLSVAWIYSVHSAPLDLEEAVILEDKIQSCLKQSLPNEMKMTYDVCAEQNPSSEMVNDNEILTCILKAEEMITGEEGMGDLSKLKSPQAPAEEAPMPEEVAAPVEPNFLSEAIQVCEENEEVKAGKVPELIQCLLENLLMNCTIEKKEMEMVPMAMEEHESKEMSMVLPESMEEAENAPETE